jgi:hypothetical protein
MCEQADHIDMVNRGLSERMAMKVTGYARCSTATTS